MKAFLICPWDRTITEVNITDPDKGSGLARLISQPEHEVSCVGSVCFTDAGDYFFIDDNGGLAPGRPCWRWSIDPPGRAYAGRAVVLGNVGPASAEPSAYITRSQLCRMVVWTELETTGEFEPPRNGTAMFHGIEVPSIIGGDIILQPRGTHAAQAQGAK